VKRSTKAVLLSGLVFPGTGHMYLKRWMAGILLFGIAACASWYIGAVVMETASVIAEKIQSGAVTPDMDVITKLVAEQSSGTEQAIKLAKIVWLACWVIGIVGSYRQGRARDQLENAAS
jgi:TM2 domain-containing membrane protein YozV